MKLEYKPDPFIAELGKPPIVQRKNINVAIIKLSGRRPVKSSDDVKKSAFPYAGGAHDS